MISQAFETQIVQITDDGTEIPVFPELAKSIVVWERELGDDEPDVDLDIHNSDDDDEEGDDSEPEDEEEEEDDEEGFLVPDSEEPDGQVRVVALASAEMLADFKALETSTGEYELRFTYGQGAIVRAFDITNSATLAMSSGDRNTDPSLPLAVEIYFDVFGQDTRY